MDTILIGERLNSSNRKIRELFESGDLEGLLDIAGKQVDCGASIIDINCSMLMEAEKEWLIRTGEAVTERLGVRIAVDSPDFSVLSKGAERFGEACLLNSITCDEEALRSAAGLLSDTGAAVIVMAKDSSGIPESPEGRLALAERAAGILGQAGIGGERIFLDPVITPVATDPKGPGLVLETLRAFKAELPGCRRVGGLSNVSFGLPGRKKLNRSFLAMAIAAGLDAVICDVTDHALMDALAAAETLSGRDQGCREYLRRYRAGKASL